MSVVIDANLLVALASGDPRGNFVLEKFLEWVEQGTSLHAPHLIRYEVANAFTRLIVANLFPVNRTEEAFSSLSVLPVTYHEMTTAPRVIEIFLQLNRQNAYDAAYLALAENLGATLYTLDGPLYRNAIGQGFDVKLLEKDSA